MVAAAAADIANMLLSSTISAAFVFNPLVRVTRWNARAAVAFEDRGLVDATRCWWMLIGRSCRLLSPELVWISREHLQSNIARVGTTLSDEYVLEIMRLIITQICINRLIRGDLYNGNAEALCVFACVANAKVLHPEISLM